DVVAGVGPAPASARHGHCEEQASGLACLSGSLAAGQETCLGASGFSRHAPTCGARSHPQDGASLPADQTGLCTGPGQAAAGSFLCLAHILFGEPVPTPDQVRGRLSPEYALMSARLGLLAHAL